MTCCWNGGKAVGLLTVSPETNARALAATLPRARLVLLKDVGHMPHHAAPEVVVNAIDDLVRGDLSAAPT
jgi:pimeloyl-ACP methyl ester carboxylesterase